MSVDVDGTADPSSLVDFIAGTVGGIASLLAGHPFDTIKTRLQAQPHGSVSPSTVSIGSSASSPLLQTASTGHGGKPRRYASAWDALRRIVAEERFVGLYKGVTSPMLGVAAMNASIFGVYGVALRSLEGSSSVVALGNGASTVPGHAGPSLTNIFLAGCASGIVSALITSPIELIKIRQQLSFDATQREPSTWSVVRDVRRRGGIRGLYRGLGCTCVRDIGYGPYFLTYELLNRFLLSLHTEGVSSQRRQLTNVEMAVSGGLAGVLAWLSTFGADVVKTRVQASERMANEHGSAFVTAARATFRQGGWRAFLAGVGPTVVRALPVNAVLFITFEATKDYLTRMGL